MTGTASGFSITRTVSAFSITGTACGFNILTGTARLSVSTSGYNEMMFVSQDSGRPVGKCCDDSFSMFSCRKLLKLVQDKHGPERTWIYDVLFL